ncbi:MAG: MFS transporter [Bacteroidetes bacterium]|nr:MAG: MFS transporter [Bacteroidota bacterium]
MKALLNFIKKPLIEYDFFLSMPYNMRVLLVTNMVYAFVLPVVDIFVSAYIMRSSNDPTLVATYQLFLYVGIPFTFLINGFLLNKFNISNLYSFGMLLSGISMLIMMSLDNMDLFGVAFAGLIMGSSFGFFWANRDFLALITTNDDNRNYYYGLETFFFTTTSIIIPFAVGSFLVSYQSFDWLKNGDITAAYQVVTYCVLAVTVISGIIIHKGKFSNPSQKKFIYFKFDKLWGKMLFLSGLKGLAQGFLVTAPAILILRLVGDENSLGIVQSISGIVTAIALYIIGRVAKPKHRIAIFTVGLFIFFIGALANASLFSATGVMIFVLCLVLFRPLHDIAYFPIQMKVIDILSKKENRSEFAYIFNHEFGLFVGRFLGLTLFIVLSTYVSIDFSLKYSILIIAALQLISIPVAKHITKAANNEHKEKPSSTPEATTIKSA